MQLFGNEGKEDNSKVQIGTQEIKVVKASSLPEGVTSVRFYPLSPDFHKGAEYISIVQYLHWLNRRPCVCRRSSYDYSVPDVDRKPLIDTSCIICNDKFTWFKKAKAFKETDKPEYERLRQIGKDLMEKVTASSIVSFMTTTKDLSPPVILRYGKELLDQIQLHASRIVEGGGAHICDPVKGFMFDIIIGKNEGGFRTYKNSMPQVNNTPVDITRAPWKWDEICQAIRSEIKEVLSPDDLQTFYFANYGGSSTSQTFHHPSFQQKSTAETAKAPAPQQNTQVAEVFTPPVEETIPSFTPPQEETKNTFVPTFSASPQTAVVEPATKTVEVQEKKSSRVGGKLFPCHGSLEESEGYDQNDANCKICQQAKTCYEAGAGKSEATSVPVNTNSAVSNGVAFNRDDIQSKLAELNAILKP
jgi:hypothetical protein